jgi:hypothetical protein
MTRRTLFGALILLSVFPAIGALALLTHQPLLFPSLGPTHLGQIATPSQPSATPGNTLVGHGIDIIAAVFSLAITGANHMPDPILTGVSSWQRELASALPVMFTFFGQAIFRASHAPAAATALLSTLGAIHPELRAIAGLCSGVLLITVLGESGRWVISRIAVAAPRALHDFRPNEL